MNKKIFIFLFFSLLFIDPAKSKTIGEGNFNMNDSMVSTFHEYIKGKKGSPEAFVVAVDGSFSMFFACPVGNCYDANLRDFIKQCEKQAYGECKVFARKKSIKWKNGINLGKGKVSRISSKLDLYELKSKLTDLGFYGNASTTTTKNVEKTEYQKQIEIAQNIISDNKQLKKAKDKCKELGFTKGTEDFDDCVTITLSKQ